MHVEIYLQNIFSIGLSAKDKIKNILKTTCGDKTLKRANKQGANEDAHLSNSGASYVGMFSIARRVETNVLSD